jgi:succinate dehydrogenase / fumarate reductase membrane anchor subunit
MGTGTGIGRVRGLGSAKHGAVHWWRQRLTAAGNLILVTWFVTSLLRLPVLDHKAVVMWLSSPFVAVAMVLMTINVFWHLRLGLQVFIEDYVHEEGSKVAALLLLNFYAVAAPALAIFSILKIAFGGVPA